MRFRDVSLRECASSALGFHDEGSNRNGKCTWCGQRFTRPAPRPSSFEVSELADAYGMHFDPDYEPHEPLRLGEPLRRNAGEWD